MSGMPKVLIIESNTQLAEIIGRHLRDSGLEAEIAPDGQSGLHSLADDSYDLLLVDRQLPDINGDEVCRQVRKGQEGAQLPIILMSGSVKDPSDSDRLTRELHLSGFLVKPFSRQQFGAMVDAALRRENTGSPPRSDGAAVLPPPVQGDLERTPFEQVLLYLLFKRGTGSLTVSGEPGPRLFSFIGGAPVEIDVPAGADDFGGFLAKKNLVGAAELSAYREARKRPGTDPRDLFIKMGCLAPDRLREENRNFLNDRIVDCFAWRTGTVRFDWRPSFLPALFSAEAALPGLLYRGFRAHLPAARLGRFLEARGSSFVGKTPAFYDYQNHLAAESGAAELFDLIDGLRTCNDVVGALDTDEATAVLYTLDFLKVLSYDKTPMRSDLEPPYPLRERRPLLTKKEVETFEDLGEELSGLVEEIDELEIPAGPASPDQTSPSAELAGLEQDLRTTWEQVKDKNYYEMFGMTPKSFSIDRLKQAYFDFTKRFGPEKFFASSGEVMELAEDFLSRISNAYTTLTNVVSKEHYDEILASQVPTGAEERKFYEKVQFQSGKVLLEKGQFESAEKTFTTCLNLDPDRPEYHAYLAFAIYHNPASRGSAAAAKRAKDLVNKSLQMEKLPIAYALKGVMLLDEGLLNLAEAEFNKALKLNPGNKIALRNLEIIRQRQEEERKSGGIFHRLFK